MVIPRIKGSQGKTLLEQTIDDLFVVGGQTTLLDAIQTIADGLGPHASDGVASERVIILITDGEDRKSQVNEPTLIQKLKAAGTKVYAIGMIQQLRSPSKASDLLKNMTKETGTCRVYKVRSRRSSTLAR